MTAEQQIYALPSPLLGVFPEHLPNNTPLPALFYQRIGGQKRSTNCGYDEEPEIRLTLFAPYPKERADLVAQIKAVCTAAGLEQDNPTQYSFDYATKAHVAIWSYRVDE